MKIILTDKIQKLGEIGDVVEVIQPKTLRDEFAKLSKRLRKKYD